MEDPENVEIIEYMNIALKKLKMWVDRSEFTSKSERFEGRTPIGAVTAPIKGMDHIFVAIPSENEDYTPQLDQTLLIFKEDGDEVLSGVVEDYRVSKKDLARGMALLKVRFMKSHGISLRDIRRIKGIPTPGAPVFEALTEEIHEIHGLVTPAEGITLGVIYDHGDMMRIQETPVKYILKDSFLAKHMAIGGLTGQGKSILLKNLILELAEKQTNLIVIDTQGDLCQIMKPMPEELLDIDTKIMLNELGLELEGLEDMLMSRDMSFYKPFFVNVEGFLTIFPWKEFGIESKNVKTGEELALYLPNLTKKAKNVLEALFNVFMKEVDSFNFEQFYNRITEKMQEGKNQYCWKIADSSHEIMASKPTAQNLLRELANFKVRQIFDRVPQPDIKEILGKKIAFFYLPRIRGYEELRTLLLFELISKIISFKTQAANRGKVESYLKRQSVVIIDEAHELIANPHGTSGHETTFTKHVDEEFRILATEGRKYMVSMICASQSLRKLNPNVVEQSNTLVLFRGSKADIDTLSIPTPLKKELLGLTVGNALVYCPGNLPTKNASEIRIYPPRFLHVNPLKATTLFLEGQIRKYQF